MSERTLKLERGYKSGVESSINYQGLNTTFFSGLASRAPPTAWLEAICSFTGKRFVFIQPHPDLTHIISLSESHPVQVQQMSHWPEVWMLFGLRFSSTNLGVVGSCQGKRKQTHIRTRSRAGQPPTNHSWNWKAGVSITVVQKWIGLPGSGTKAKDLIYARTEVGTACSTTPYWWMFMHSLKQLLLSEMCYWINWILGLIQYNNFSAFTWDWNRAEEGRVNYSVMPFMFRKLFLHIAW